MKQWKTALLVIGALAVVPGIVLIIIGIMISCFRKGSQVVLASLKCPCVAAYMYSCVYSIPFSIATHAVQWFASSSRHIYGICYMRHPVPVL